MEIAEALDLIASLQAENAALRAQLAGCWLPMETAPLDRKVLLLCDSWGRSGYLIRVGEYNDDRFAKKPRPYWQSMGSRTTFDRDRPPKAWMYLPNGDGYGNS